MNKKITAFATALAMTASLGVAPAITASAATDPVALKAEVITAFDNLATNNEIGLANAVLKKVNDAQDGDYIEFIAQNSGDYSSFTDLLLDANVQINDSDNYSQVTNAMSNLKVNVVLDMAKVATAYSDYITLATNLAAFSNSDGIVTELIDNSKVSGEFTINITLPSNWSFTNGFANDNKSLTGFSFDSGNMAVSTIFTEESRTQSGNGLEIKIKMNNVPKTTLDVYFNGASTPDLVLTGTVVAPAPTTTMPTTYEISGNMSGFTEILTGSGLKVGEVNYKAIQQNILNETDRIVGNDIILSETATLTKPSGGGGGGGSANPRPTTTPTPTPTPTPTASPEPTINPSPSAAPVPDGSKVTVEVDKNNPFAYIYGYPEGDVRPENNISRAEVTAIFYRLLTEASREAAKSTTNNFTDVTESDWFNTEVSTMSNAKVINGYEDGTFKPNNYITRAEFATIAARFTNMIYTGSQTKFNDITGHWAENAINLAAEIGYVNGYEDGSFKPDAYISRAEAITLINRVIERSGTKNPDSYKINWPDNTPDDWYYHAVQKATNDIEVIDNIG